MLYFAYGSNMFLPQLRCRCPSAKFLFKVTLHGRTIAFTRTSIKRKCGVADIVKAAGEVVWGAVFQIADVEVPALDSAEGVKVDASKRSVCRVFRDNDPNNVSDVETYFAKAANGKHVPSAEYLALLIAGATEWRLPADYISKLRKISIQC